MEKGAQAGTYELFVPGGRRLAVEYSATAHVSPGRHLSILISPVPGGAHPPPENAPAPLTPREREVLEQVALGGSSGEIAERLGIAEDTVRNHVKNAMAKLGARHRAHAVALAIRRGELTL